jgi:hypothetical protein
MSDKQPSPLLRKWQPLIDKAKICLTPNGKAVSVIINIKENCKTEPANAFMTELNHNPDLARKLWSTVVPLINKSGRHYYFAAELMILVDKTSEKKSFEKAYTQWRIYMKSEEK